jgi:hypothetical protein
MFESEGKLSARIVELSVPKTAEGKEKTDIYNPDPKKRGCPIIGLVFISGFIKKSDTRWENGTVYDPKSGKTYSCFMELEGPDKNQSARLSCYAADGPKLLLDQSGLALKTKPSLRLKS